MAIKTLPYAIIVTTLSTLVMTTQADDVYKWVDKNGHTHYSQNPSREQTNTLIKTRKTSTKAIHPVAESLPTKKPHNPSTSENIPKAVKDNALCKKAQTNIQVLSNRPMVMQEGKLLTIDEKNKQIQAARDIARIHC